MTHLRILSFLLTTILFLLSSSIHADDKKIATWTQQVLLETLSVSYLDTPKDTAPLRACYTNDAWEAMTDFLGNYMSMVRTQKLSLNPIANGPATVVASGVIKVSNFFEGVQYWRVNQSITMEVLNLRIDFSVIVIEPPRKDKLLIQSLNMVIH